MKMEIIKAQLTLIMGQKLAMLLWILKVWLCLCYTITFIDPLFGITNSCRTEYGYP